MSKLTDIAFYIPVRDKNEKTYIVSIELKEAVDGNRILKPLNGYWVKKSAIISNMQSSKKILSFEEFKKEMPDIQSPFVGEEGIMYKAVYDKLTDRVQYFKNGRRNSTKITVKKAYDTYLFDNDKKMEKGGNLETLQQQNEKFNKGKAELELKGLQDAYNATTSKNLKSALKIKIEKQKQIVARHNQKMETGGEIESGMIVTFKDVYGDLHNGKVISKNNIKNAFDVVEITTQKEYLVSPSQIVS